MISLVYVDLKFINWFTDEFYVTDQDFKRYDCINHEIILVLRL